MTKYRSRKEIALLSQAEVLAELDTLKIEPEEKVVFPADVFDAQGVVSASGDPPDYLTDSQKNECRTKGTVLLTFQQQVQQGTSWNLWRTQIYNEGVHQYVKSLGLARCLKQLKERKADMTVWESRNATRGEVEKRLTYAIHQEERVEA